MPCHHSSIEERNERSLQIPNGMTISSSDKFGSKPTSKEVNTDLQYEGFVDNFRKCAFDFSSCRAIKRPLISPTSNETTQSDKGRCACFGYQRCATLERLSQTERDMSMDIAGSKRNVIEANTARQNDGFVHNFKERASFFRACHAIARPSKGATRGHCPKWNDEQFVGQVWL